MRLAHIVFVAGRVVRSLKELFWTHLLTAGVMAMILLVFGGFLLIQENLGRMVRGWGEELHVFVYLDDEVDAAAATELRARLESFPEVRAARYVSRERAWEDFKNALGSQSGILEGLDPAMLPASLELEVRAGYRSRDAVARLVERLEAQEGVQDVEYPETWLERLRLLRVGMEWLKWVLGGVLFLVAFLIVGSTIKLAIVARRDEIEVMQLVGAGAGLIKAPFVIEGMIQGLVGGALALGLLQAAFSLLGAELLASFGPLAAGIQFAFLDSRQCVELLLLGWLLGTAGSVLSVRRFLT